MTLGFDRRCALVKPMQAMSAQTDRFAKASAGGV